MKLPKNIQLLLFLSLATTLVSLAIIFIMTIQPTTITPSSLSAGNAGKFIAAFVLARTLPLSAAFFWLLWRKQYDKMPFFFVVLALVQAGDALIGVAYGNVGGAVGPIVSTVIYAYTAYRLQSSTLGSTNA